MEKVAIVINDAWAAYNFRFNLARALKKIGYSVVFIAPYNKKYSHLIDKEFEFLNVSIEAKGVNPIRDLITIVALYKLYKINKIDVVLNFTIKPNIYSSIAAGILGLRVVSNITGLGTVFIKQTLVTNIVKLLYREALRFNDKVFFQNSDDIKLFLDNNLVVKEKIDLLPGSGVDLNKFIPVMKRNNNSFRFLLIARLLKDKGILEFIEAVKIIKEKCTNVECQILGAVGVDNKTAITKEELQIWVDLGLVDYLGTTDSVQDIIANVDCVVLPSYREGMPRSLLEACAMEKPIIATNVEGCKEIVDDNVNGYLCKVRDVNDLASKMEMMVNLSNKQRLMMGKAGREKIIQKFDEQIVLSKYIKTIKEI